MAPEVDRPLAAPPTPNDPDLSWMESADLPAATLSFATVSVRRFFTSLAGRDAYVVQRATQGRVAELRRSRTANGVPQIWGPGTYIWIRALRMRCAASWGPLASYRLRRPSRKLIWSPWPSSLAPYDLLIGWRAPATSPTPAPGRFRRPRCQRLSHYARERSRFIHRAPPSLRRAFENGSRRPSADAMPPSRSLRVSFARAKLKRTIAASAIARLSADLNTQRNTGRTSSSRSWEQWDGICDPERYRDRPR